MKKYKNNMIISQLKLSFFLLLAVNKQKYWKLECHGKILRQRIYLILKQEKQELTLPIKFQDYF